MTGTEISDDERDGARDLLEALRASLKAFPRAASDDARTENSDD